MPIRPALLLLLFASAARAAPPAWDPWRPAPAPAGPVVVSSPALAGLGALAVYRGMLAPGLGAACAFAPSCSRYAGACVAAHGLVNGSWLAAERLGRCHGFALLGGCPLRPDGLLEDPAPAAAPVPVLAWLGL